MGTPGSADREGSMNDDRSEADRILSEDWMMPGYRRYVEAWGKHPQRELLAERRGEVGQTGGRGGAPSASSMRTAGSSTGYAPPICATGARASASVARPRRSRRTTRRADPSVHHVDDETRIRTYSVAPAIRPSTKRT